MKALNSKSVLFDGPSEDREIDETFSIKSNTSGVDANESSPVSNSDVGIEGDDTSETRESEEDEEDHEERDDLFTSTISNEW